MACAWIARVVSTSILLLAASFSFIAHAHLTPNSEGRLDLYQDKVEIEIIIPAAEYSYASENPVSNEPQSLAAASAYLSENIRLLTAEQAPWQTELVEAEFVELIGPRDLRARMVFRPPEGRDPRQFQLVWSAVVETVPDHFSLILLRSDVAGKLGPSPEVIGSVRNGRTTVPIDQGRSSELTRFLNAVLLGGEHILGGLDHLLFLFALLLPAPLVSHAGKWKGQRGWRPTLKALAIVITGFTIGHSATLIAASLLGWSLPSGPVEIVIALSVVLASIHAIKPIFAQREAIVATGFGLVHGLGFAGFLSSTDIELSSNVMTLLGFNIGIELVQLAFAAIVAPSLIVLASLRGYHWLRVVLAAICGLVASLWAINRSIGLADGFVTGIEVALSHAGWLVVALVVLAVGIKALHLLSNTLPKNQIGIVQD